MQLLAAVRTAINKIRHALYLIVKPLVEPGDMGIRMSIPETQTTTVDGDIGWDKRPPATLACPDCGSDIYHYRPRDEIDCSRCNAEFDYDEFGELELKHMECPYCRIEMEHGSRHPKKVRVPEYATCHKCRYHWELEHF